MRMRSSARWRSDQSCSAGMFFQPRPGMRRLIDHAVVLFADAQSCARRRRQADKIYRPSLCLISRLRHAPGLQKKTRSWETSELSHTCASENLSQGNRRMPRGISRGPGGVLTAGLRLCRACCMCMPRGPGRGSSPLPPLSSSGWSWGHQALLRAGWRMDGE